MRKCNIHIVYHVCSSRSIVNRSMYIFVCVCVCVCVNDRKTASKTVKTVHESKGKKIRNVTSGTH